MYTELVTGHAVIQNDNSKPKDEYTPICTMAFTIAAGCFFECIFPMVEFIRHAATAPHFYDQKYRENPTEYALIKDLMIRVVK